MLLFLLTGQFLIGGGINFPLGKFATQINPGFTLNAQKSLWRRNIATIGGEVSLSSFSFKPSSRTKLGLFYLGAFLRIDITEKFSVQGNTGYTYLLLTKDSLTETGITPCFAVSPRLFLDQKKIFYGETKFKFIEGKEKRFWIFTLILGFSL